MYNKADKLQREDFYNRTVIYADSSKVYNSASMSADIIKTFKNFKLVNELQLTVTDEIVVVVEDWLFHFVGRSAALEVSLVSWEMRIRFEL